MPQSPELAGGAGFTLEGAVAAYFLVSLLAEGRGPGIESRIVTRVATQQRDAGLPLDDIIVDFETAEGAPARLSLQCKRRLVISAAATNSDFFDIVRDSWATILDPAFRQGIDRVGAAVNEVSQDSARALRALGEAARSSPTLADFNIRLGDTGNANATMKRIHAALGTLLASCTDGTSGPADVHALLRHFVLLEFDFLHAGALHPPEAIERVAACLDPSDQDKAPLLWSHLQVLARAGAGIAAVFDRPGLLNALAPLTRLRASPSLRPDINALRTLSRSYAETIFDDVGGVRLPRPSLDQSLDEALASNRLVQLRGLAGCGKSVLLKMRVLEAADRGPLLFLKADQLEGRSWAAFAVRHGLSTSPLRNLLIDIGAHGTAILFIDAIDRIEIEQQPIVAEILRLIARDPQLASWKVIVSLRDSGVELLRNWLGDVLDTLGVATVSVGTLDDTDADILAGAVPQLRPLLFGGPAIRDIVRRPFFAKVLVQGYVLLGGGFEPQTEVDLADHWWRRGGYDSSGRDALVRQRTIIELARERAGHPSEPIAVRALTSAAIEELAGLVGDGILQWTSVGHALRFSHDIFFEWAFYHRLQDEGRAWIDAIKTIGEPPVAARPVELLAQAQFAAGDQWREALPLLAQSGMRSQWMRAWLLGPIGTSTFLNQTDRYWSAIAVDDFRLLKKALVWFQAEKTIPNPNILAASILDPDERQRAADLLGWPSDFAAWRRLIAFLEAVADRIPARLYPDILAIFEVWQRTLGNIANPTSQALLGRCAGWLEAIDRHDKARRREMERQDEGQPAAADEARWKDVPEFKSFRGGLVDLILRAAKPYPDHAATYLRRVLSDTRQLNDDIGHILQASPFLAVAHPGLLVDATFQHLRGALPEEKIAEDNARNRAAAEARDRALAKPEAERSRIDQVAIGGHFFSYSAGSFSTADWGSLSLDRDIENFSPAAPTREPFPSLFVYAPDEALRLVRALSAHAVTAWRQLHRHDWQREGTPVPLRIVFPWGEQLFWGGAREYLWCRGVMAPDSLGCALLALDNWAHAELERGADPDALIRQCVEGNDAIAVLGIAVAIALERDLVSEASLALVTAQRLLLADRHRFRQEQGMNLGVQMGRQRRADRVHADATSASHERPVRRQSLTKLVPLFLFGDAERAARLSNAFAAFPTELAFIREEQRDNEEAIAALRIEAANLAELADLESYRAYRTKVPDQVLIVHESPSANTAEAEAARQAALNSLSEHALWGVAKKAFDIGKIEDPDAFARHLALARSLDSPDLYLGAGEDIEIGIRRGGVAAIAAMILHFREGQDGATLIWARDVLKRAVCAPDREGRATPSAKIPWHEASFAARGFAADIRSGTDVSAARSALLRLVAHPLEAVASLTVREAFGLWDVDPRLGWAALSMALALCTLPRRRWDDDTDDIPTAEDRAEAALGRAEAIHVGSDWPLLPSPPPAWVELSEDEARVRRHHVDARELSDVIDPMRIWAPADAHWHGSWAGELIGLVPIAAILESPARSAFLQSITRFLDWTIARNAPPWKKPGRRDDPDSNLHEWTHGLGSLVGKILSEVRLAEVRARLFDPILTLEGEACWSLLAPLAETFVCAGVYDALELHADAVELLMACVDRMLGARQLQRDGWRSGTLTGFDQPRLARTLMLISVEHAGGAARFANGDWTALRAVLPVIDRFVRGAGWAPTIMGGYLTLSERARDAYPAKDFAEQLLYVLGPGDEAPAGWSSYMLPARIAGMIQHLSTREAPMAPGLAQALLRLLDRLVDMGDRRSAALQLSEAFREVRVS